MGAVGMFTTGVSAGIAPGSPYQRGYVHPSSLQPLLDRSHGTLLHRTVATALSDHAVCIAAIAAALLAYRNLPSPLAVLIHGFALVVSARCQRGLENLAHDAAHYNWTRRRKLNDFLADGLVALPVASRVKLYRAGHARHHRWFGTHQDPDRQRYGALALEELDRTSLRTYVVAIAQRLPAYTKNWWCSIGTAWRTTVEALIWHACFFVLPAWVVLGLEASIFLWGTWIAGFSIVLPVLRLIAESNEHIYSDAQSVFDATMTNLGICNRLVIHPHNDGFHTAHHLWPRVPHHRLADLHTALMALDPNEYGKRLRYRTRVLEHPPSLEPVPCLPTEIR